MHYVVKNDQGTPIATFLYRSIAQVFADAEFEQLGRVVTIELNTAYLNFRKAA